MPSLLDRFGNYVLGALAGAAVAGAIHLFTTVRRLELIEYRLRQIECRISIGDCARKDVAK